MGPQEFEHVIAAAAEVTSQDEFVVIGSQAILGSVGQPPASLLQSLEADIYPLRDPAAADLIDGALGDGSPFHLAFGYYGDESQNVARANDEIVVGSLQGEAEPLDTKAVAGKTGLSQQTAASTLKKLAGERGGYTILSRRTAREAETRICAG